MDRYGRQVARCFLGDTDLNGWMVDRGLALAYRTYSEDDVAQEKAAEGAERGLWSGTFYAPWDWRKGDRQVHSAALGKDPETRPKAATSAAPSGCALKGNISRSGRRIFHSPGQRDYGRTVVSLDKGERWFCSEQEAVAAGWRAAQR